MQFNTCPSNYYQIFECSSQFCVHNQFWSNENQPWAIFSKIFFFSFFLGYFVQFIITGISSCTGLGGEVQKQSVLMTMLGYYQYESTNITYYVTLGCTISSFITICIEKKLHLIDYDIIFLILPMCVSSTDLGNYFNRIIPDFVVLIVIMIFEISFAILLIAFALKLKRKQRESTLDEIAFQQQVYDTFLAKPDNLSMSLGNVNISTPSNKQFALSFENSNNQSPYYKSLILILLIQLSIQVALLFRSGNKYNTQYNSNQYWVHFYNNFQKIITLLIYLVSFIILSVIYCYQQRQREKDRLNEDPDYCKKREDSMKFLVILLGMIACFFTGLIGIGVGMVLASSLIIIKKMKIRPINVVYTMIICEMITSMSLIEQSMINYVVTEPVNFVYYFSIGLVSSSIFFQFVRKMKHEYIIPLTTGILFVFDTVMIIIFISTRFNGNLDFFESFIPNC